MALADNTRTVPELFTSVVSQLADLTRTEGQLARAEISEKMTLAATGVGLIVGGAILLMPALVLLLEAAVTAHVNNGISPYCSALLLGRAWLVDSLILPVSA